MAKRTGRAEISIRALEVEDAPELARLQAMPGYRFGTLRTPYPSVASVRRFLERSGSDDLHLGAFIGGRLVGSAGLLRLAGRQRHVASFGMGVADDLNGRGIGTKLLQALMDAADN